jgi:hypothetical protein
MVTQEYLLHEDGTKEPYEAHTDVARLVLAWRNGMITRGEKLHTYDEIMDAFHDERAGGEGLEVLWKDK